MKIKLFMMLSLAAAVLFCGCTPSDADMESTEARISLSPSSMEFYADGLTADGQASGTYIVVVNPYSKMFDSWKAELIDTDWAKLDVFTTSPDGVVEKTIRITCGANTGYRRTGTLRITLDTTGESAEFPIEQTGLKADATLALSTEAIQMMALEPADEVISFETNMFAGTVKVAAKETADWIGWDIDTANKTITLSAQDNLSQTESRSVVLVVSAGTEDTSIATAELTVTQFANETYLFIYGTGVPHFLTLDKARQMNKSDMTFSLNHYFRTGKVILALSTNPAAYPRYAVDANGAITEIADAAAEASVAAATFDIAGMRNLKVNIALDGNLNIVAGSSTAEFSRISTANCLPDSEVSGYGTKDYEAYGGGTKTWMTTSLHWNGGPAMGTYKLGSGLVAGVQTGGYSEAAFTSRNSAYDTKENGGSLDELMMPDGTTTRASVYGRLYSPHEALTGSPSGALSSEKVMTFPLGGSGTQMTDAIGNTYTFKNMGNAALVAYAATTAGDALAESENPALRMQVQGICPYGWHIANMQDWRDLIYAAHKFSQGKDYVVSAETATYGNMATETSTNVAALLRLSEWKNDEFSTASVVSASAAEFGFNMYPQGWRLYTSGYNYCANSGNPRFYAYIPVLGNTDTQLWRAYCTNSDKLIFNGAFNAGDASGAAVRCVKNYETF